MTIIDRAFLERISLGVLGVRYTFLIGKASGVKRNHEPMH